MVLIRTIASLAVIVSAAGSGCCKKGAEGPALSRCQEYTRGLFKRGACNANTARGYVWTIGARADQAPSSTMVGMGDTPACGPETEGATAVAARWWSSGGWLEVREHYFVDRPEDAEQCGTAGKKNWCGIFAVTCAKQGER